ncbi:MAG TPA: DNA cytosine methyltransferase [Kiritimatiellia bacterium]|nr:DNA cytosine methyltransferase [Kiritimatiellia bacterium]HMO99563.1 DNA cytosine methyltransferase [Kiritimatiellia bacterium]
MKSFGFYEFFAGGGMARLGLGERWNALFANDVDAHKALAYAENFRPSGELVVGDVNNVSAFDLPHGGIMAWASFPCQDLSLAGRGGGIDASRSGCYWPFWNILRDLATHHRMLPIVALENVVGLLHANGGLDFQRLLGSLRDLGYCYGAMVVDAIHFLPQSRPRLFIVAAAPELLVGRPVATSGPVEPWHPDGLTNAVVRLPSELAENWVWWKMPQPARRHVQLENLVMDVPSSTAWHEPSETKRLLGMMTPLNRRKVEAASKLNRRVVGTIYKRTRVDSSGVKRQRAEVRFDGVAGCLRTPAGGSSRQIIIVVEGRNVRTRLLDTREAARLMGVPDSYKLPENYNDAYHLMGDGLAVPAVAWVEKHVLRPLAIAACSVREAPAEAVA